MPPTEPGRWERMLFESLGDVSGLRVLDLGCGHGELTLQLAARGADVLAIDISPGMVGVTKARAERFCPYAQVEARVAAVEHTGIKEASLDLVTGKWVLHHVDVAAAAAEIRRILRPGGRAVFFENQSLNPLLSYAREHLVGRFGIPRFGTEDEHPLTRSDYALWRTMFSGLALEYPDFHFFELLGRQLFHDHWGIRDGLRRVDRFLWERVPALRPYSFHVIVTATN